MERTSIYELLKKDHRDVEQLFQQILQGRSGMTMSTMSMQPSEDLFARLSMMLTAHMKAEEKVFYDPLKDKDETREDIAHGFQEHHEAQNMLKQIAGMPRQSTDWMNKVQELQKAIHHHIEDEEGKTFPHSQKILNTSQADDMGQRFLSEKQKIMQQAA